MLILAIVLIVIFVSKGPLDGTYVCIDYPEYSFTFSGNDFTFSYSGIVTARGTYSLDGELITFRTSDGDIDWGRYDRNTDTVYDWDGDRYRKR